MENSAISTGTKRNPCLVLLKNHANQLPELDLICRFTQRQSDSIQQVFTEALLCAKHRVRDMEDGPSPQSIESTRT